MKKPKTISKLHIPFVIIIFLAIAAFISAMCTYHFVSYGNEYLDMYDVASYIYKYNELPSNFVTKSQRHEYANRDDSYRFILGGDEFYNREGRLDNPQNKPFVECDVHTDSYSINSRGAERFVFFADGSAVYYTQDHYESFVLITIWNINYVSFILFGAFVVLDLILIVSAIVLLIKNDELTRSEVGLSFMIAAVLLLEVMLCVPIFVLWIIERIHDGVSTRKNKNFEF